MSSTFTVVTYNIAMGLLSVRLERALQRRRWLRPLARVLPSLARTCARHAWLGQMDVLGLQEVCLADAAQGRYFEDLFRARSIEPACHSGHEGPEPRLPCAKGQLLLSRFAMRTTGTLPLPRVGSHRAAIWADLHVPGIAGARGDLVRVYDLHLSNRDGRDWRPLEGRLRQIRVVLDHAHALEAEHPGAPAILLGDFNTLGNLWWPFGREPALREVARWFAPALPRFRPTMLFPHMLDHVFYRHLHLDAARVLYLPFSDHFPVAARFHTAP
jgi:endonuclease/exonuclease/phosphatase family metal-dependent hydrolase